MKIFMVLQLSKLDICLTHVHNQDAIFGNLE